MSQTTFDDNVIIDGSQDIPQLTVEGHSTQTEPLQVWQDSAASPQAQVTGDGRLQFGDFEPDGLMATDDALIEAHRASTSTKPKRGFHALGRIGGALSDAVTWAAHELEFVGSGGVSGLHTTLRAKLTHVNEGDGRSGEFRAGDFQALNQTGSSGEPVGQVTGVRGTASNVPDDVNAYLSKAVGVEATVTNAAGGNISEAAAFEVASPQNNGTIDTFYGLKVADLEEVGASNVYALHTGKGTTHLGDDLEFPVFTSAPTDNPPADFLKLYPKLVSGAPKLYAKNSSGVETEVSGTAFPNQNPNVVFAGPVSGATAAPAFRGLVSGDIPNLDAGKITSGLISNSRINWSAPGAIGTTTPAFGQFGDLRVVSATTGVGEWLISPAGFTRQILFGTDSISKPRWAIATNSTPESGGNTGSDFMIGRFNDAGTWVSASLFIERAGGKVGIGTLSPAQMLHVTGGAYLTSSNAGVAIAAGFTTPYKGVEVLYNAMSLAGEIRVHDPGVAWRPLSLNSQGGNVGIGTLAPSTKLDVNGAARADALTVLPAMHSSTAAIEIGQGRTQSGNAQLDLVGDTAFGDAGLRIIRWGSGISSISHRGTTPLQIEAVDAGSIDLRTGGLSRFSISNSLGLYVGQFQVTGSIGIGISASPFQLRLSSDSAAKPNGGMWSNSSDIRLKRNIENYAHGLSFLKQLPNPIQYEYNGKAGTPDGAPGVGFAAQDLQKRASSWVQTVKGKLDPEDESETDLLYVNASDLTFVLMNSVLELATRMEKLEKVS